MAEENNVPTQEELQSRDRLALLVSIIFVFAIGILGYRFLNNTNNIKSAFYNVTSDDSTVSEDIIASSTVRDLEADQLNEENQDVAGAQDENQEALVEDTQNSMDSMEQNAAPEEATNPVITMEESNQMVQDNTATTSDTWHVNDYNQGDIKPGETYTVKSGDTLWEIAEAVYGNGAQWTQILQANSGSIGYLANGQQALIVTGQTIAIPMIN